MTSPLTDLLPSVQRALLGIDLPPLVSAEATTQSDTVIFRLRFSGRREWTNEDAEEMECVLTEILSDFVEPPIGSRLDWSDESDVVRSTGELLEHRADLPERFDDGQS